ARRGEPLTYYHRLGPAGDVFAALPDGPRRVGLVGLGAGALAAYARRGDAFEFYELDPDVVGMAAARFTYLSDAERRGAAVRVVPGDGRLSLARERGDAYDLLVLDAFSSDSIPVHLVTREALALYLARTGPEGLLAFHVTNRHLRLERVLAREAADAGLAAALREDPVVDEEGGRFPSEWVVVAKDRRTLAPLARTGRWVGLRGLARDPEWTDAYSSLLPILK
ncbi:MAG: fused MFS/spermidine synthase, partial [Elusimicrobia bacterium]|nr:fused MFS/spermidine synthase [Elusimicrobiota bacterium]